MDYQFSWLNLVPYSSAYELQKKLRRERIQGNIENTLLLLEHPPVITIGANDEAREDLHRSPEELEKKGIDFEKVERGGHLTYHGPGQLVCYPIVELSDRDIAKFVAKLESVVAEVLGRFDLDADLSREDPGVWVNGRKICSIGLRIKRWIASHGLAFNVDLDMRPYEYFDPCNEPGAYHTTLEDELSRAPMMENVRSYFLDAFNEVFDARGTEVASEKIWSSVYDDLPDHEERKLLPRRGQENTPDRKPEWLKASLPGGEEYQNIKNLMDEKKLNTVCEEASCPNLGECWSRGTATFMILGDTCTRACGFCDVETGTDLDVDKLEPLRVARAVDEMNLQHTVITSVNRDDLPDGGAEIWANTIESVRRENPETSIEVLIPDLMGDWDALEKIFDAKPDILNHNLETVPRLYPTVRPKARYDRSLNLLNRSNLAGFPTKSGIMLGLGERHDEIKQTLHELLEHGVTILTLGQYLRPSEKHLPVDRWVHPDEFERWGEFARDLGYDHVESGPQVRSSYHADEQVPSDDLSTV